MSEITDVEITPYRQNLSEHQSMEAQAQKLALAIKDQPTYEAAGAFLLKIADMRKRWAEFIRPAVKAAHETHVRIKAVENAVDEPLGRAASTSLKPALARYEQAEETRRREEQERINRELKKQDDDRRVNLATELEKSGKKAEAEAVIAAPPAPEVMLPKTTDIKGISYRTRYYAEVVDKEKLVCMVAAAICPLDFVEPNMTMLNGIAQSMKESVESQWKEWGLALRKERIVSAGGGR